MKDRKTFRFEWSEKICYLKDIQAETEDEAQELWKRRRQETSRYYTKACNEGIADDFAVHECNFKVTAFDNTKWTTKGNILKEINNERYV